MKQTLDLKLVAALLVLAGWCLFEIARMWNVFPPDLSALYMAGYLHANGMNDLIYARPDGFFGGAPEQWGDVQAALGLSDFTVLPYVYPPIWAKVLAPFAGSITPAAFFNAAALIQIPMIGACVLLSHKMLKPSSVPLWVWVFISVALLSTSLLVNVAIVQLQPQITVTFLIILAFERYASGFFKTAGAVLAIAAALKLAPAALAVLFLMDRNWTALRSFSTIGFCLGGLSLVLMGPALHFEFLASVRALSDGVFITSINYSIPAFLHGLGIELSLFRWVELAQHNIRLDVQEPSVRIVATAMLIAGLAWTFWHNRNRSGRDVVASKLLAVSLLISLFGPLGWAHYYVLQLLLLPGLIALIGLRRGAFAILLVGVATSRPMFHSLRATYESDMVTMGAGTCAMALLFLLISLRFHARPSNLTQNRIANAGV